MTTARHRRRPRPEALRSRTRTGLVTAALVAVGGLGLLAAGPAAATPPIDLQDEITDEAGALGGDTGEVQAALDDLAAQTEYQLYVVFVDDFSGQAPDDWTRATYEQSGLGVRDAVLAVAVQERRYYLGIDTSTGIDAAAITPDVEDRLSQDDWSGAAITAAQELQAVAEGGGPGGGTDDGQGGVPGTSSGTSTSSGGGFLTLLLVGALVIGVVLVVRTVSKRGRGVVGPVGGPGGPPPPPQGLEALPTQELDRRAASALVQVDDAVRTSEQELGFAQAQFGLEATREFQDVLTHAKAQVMEAFHLRQLLDDSTPDTEDVVRRTSIQILRLCDEVAAGLNAQTSRFDELRKMQTRAPEMLDANETRAREISARLQPARATLQQLQATYPAPALASVLGNADQAEALLTQVHETVQHGRDAVAQDDRAAAVNFARASENALGQAVTLLDAVDRAGADLAAAGERLDRAIASISSDIDDAARLAPRDTQVGPRVEAARAAIEQGRTARTGGDPLAALRTLGEAEAALDAALEPHRAEDEHRRRASALLAEALGRADSTVRATADYITTRRGAVGPEARTRLAEAARLLQVAMGQRDTDPGAALATVQRAEQLAHEAQSIARADVEEQDRQLQYRNGPGGPNVGGMILGGILIDSILRGGGGHHHGGGFGGGGFFGGGGGGGGFGGGGGGFGGGFGGSGGGF